jgi:hypothetical protein
MELGSPASPAFQSGLLPMDHSSYIIIRISSFVKIVLTLGLRHFFEVENFSKVGKWILCIKITPSFLLFIFNDDI